jgi:DNA-binding CsgD family transcriptional regulator
MPALLKQVRELVPSDSAGFFWVNAAGDMTQLYAERVLPQAASQLFFERYHDGAEHTFKQDLKRRASEPSAVSAFTPDAKTQAGDYYNTILRALDAHYILRGVVRDGGGALGQISLYRSKTGKGFNASERERLSDIVHYLAHALARPTAAAGEFTETDDEGVVLVDAQGVVQHAAGQSRRLLLMAANPQGGATASPTAPIVQAVMGDLVARLRGARTRDEHTAPPRLTVANAWGRFTLRAYHLSDGIDAGNAGDAASAPIAVQIRRQEPMVLRLAHGLRHLDLPPQLLQVALLLAQGHTNAEIASHMGVSENTVRWHVKQLFTKLQTHDRAEAIVRLKGAG